MPIGSQIAPIDFAQLQNQKKNFIGEFDHDWEAKKIAMVRNKQKNTGKKAKVDAGTYESMFSRILKCTLARDGIFGDEMEKYRRENSKK